MNVPPPSPSQRSRTPLSISKPLPTQKSDSPTASPEFSFYLGRSASGTSTRSSLCLGCVDSTHYTGTLTSIPVTIPAYWEIVLTDVTVAGQTASSSHGNAIIDTGTTLVLAPTAAAMSIFDLIPNSFAIQMEGSDEMFFAYPCDTPAGDIPAFRFEGRAFGISALDFNFGTLTAEFARLVGDEALAGRLEREEEEGRVKERAAGGGGQDCVAAIVGTDMGPEGNLYVLGDAFLKSWYSVFSFGSAGGRASVSFAEAM